MPEPAGSSVKKQAAPFGARLRGFLRSAGRGALRLIQRGYALALIVLIVWTSYRALAYLTRSLITPLQTAPQVAGVPKRLDEQLLHGRRPDWVGLAAVENPRSPLAHYHRFDTWLQSDNGNDCTRSGCHAPLPHSKHKEVRAFLNMHATSVHCGVCHMKNDATPLPLTWYDVRDGKPASPPALLRAYAWLASPPASPKPEHQKEIASLLRAAAEGADSDPALARIAQQIAAVRAESIEFPRLLEQATAIVSRSFRGSYGEKLALRDASNLPILAHPGTNSAVADFLARGTTAAPEERQKLLAAVHPQKRDMPLRCTDCHREQSSLVDFAKLGYPPARVRSLFEPLVFQMIEHISTGTPFRLPQLQGKDERDPK